MRWSVTRLSAKLYVRIVEPLATFLLATFYLWLLGWLTLWVAVPALGLQWQPHRMAIDWGPPEEGRGERAAPDG